MFIGRTVLWRRGLSIQPESGQLHYEDHCLMPIIQNKQTDIPGIPERHNNIEKDEIRRHSTQPKNIK